MLNAYSVVFAGQTAPIWIDVRTPAEYASGHVNGAVNIEFQTIAERIADVTNDKNADIRLYCRSGRRSGVAKEALVKLGYENVSNEGGYAAALVAFEKQNQKP
ncbi:MAG: rhodanese-like domain-containing protein [Pseudomonadota bacterium]